MSNRSIVATENAPAAIGTYSQAVKVGSSFEAETHQVFKNLSAVMEAAGGSLKSIVKLNIYLTDLSHFATVNAIMAEYFTQPYPARAAIGVSQLPKAARIEADGIASV